MRARLILISCLLLGFVISPFLLASGEDDTFYLYTDFDGDNKPDRRITFAGDYAKDFIQQMKFNPATACTGYFHNAWFTTLQCPDQSCPMEQPTCKPQYPEIQTIWTTNGYACHCVHELGEDSPPVNPGQTYGYVRIGDFFQLLSMSREEYESYLLRTFRVLETVSLKEGELRGGEPCDEGVSWTIDWNCKDLECDYGYTCVKNQATVVTDIAVQGDVFCRCRPAPSLTSWGIVSLVTLLISSAVYITFRKRRKATMVA